MKKAGIVIFLSVTAMLSWSQSSTVDFYKGVTAANRSDYDNAIVYFTAAIEKEENMAEAWYNRGLAYSKLSLLNEAISDYSQAIKLCPSMAKAYLNRGADHFALHCKDKALQDYNAALYLDSAYALAYYNRGILFFNDGNYANALFDFSKTVGLDSNAADWYNLGLTEEKLHRVADAINHFSRSLQLDNKNILALKHRARCYMVAGLITEALNDCMTVLKQFVGEEEALALLKELEQNNALHFSSYNSGTKTKND